LDAAMSALLPKADMCGAARDVRFGPKADISQLFDHLVSALLKMKGMNDEFCSHALVDKTDGSRVRVIEASKDWPVQKVRQSMKKG